ncbi:hypothetical protein EVAR_96705_1 [Eumeta japonica]|uniref:Uncharacterized protein n=1 Tax=Eumeta variegata TaxID=151549 RepID=A0A4C1WGF1_EUMVA|nr:hypothetical protein EVAR_96705_1 [Eumeta japonica]
MDLAKNLDKSRTENFKPRKLVDSMQNVNMSVVLKVSTKIKGIGREHGQENSDHLKIERNPISVQATPISDTRVILRIWRQVITVIRNLLRDTNAVSFRKDWGLILNTPFSTTILGSWNVSALGDSAASAANKLHGAPYASPVEVDGYS